MDLETKILQPELLSVDELTVLLKQRNINVSKVTDKDALVQLAYQHTVPHAQRKYRANRRGVAMTAKQQKRAASFHRLNYHNTNANQTYIIADSKQSGPGEAGSSRILSSSSLSAVQDRLKPPVSVVNMERKVIKLSGSRSTSSASFSKDTGYQQDTRYLKQPAVSQSNTNSSSFDDANASSSRKIRLGQPVHASAVEKPHQHVSAVDKSANTLPAKRTTVSTEETEKKKFKATAITWP